MFNVHVFGRGDKFFSPPKQKQKQPSRISSEESPANKTSFERYGRQMDVVKTLCAYCEELYNYKPKIWLYISDLDSILFTNVLGFFYIICFVVEHYSCFYLFIHFFSSTQQGKMSIKIITAFFLYSAFLLGVKGKKGRRGIFISSLMQKN